jgi:hypothetical protein
MSEPMTAATALPAGGLLGWPLVRAPGALHTTGVGGHAVNHFSSFADGAPWFAGWGTLALVNAGLAQGKNRSGLLWFLLSLPFGPLATLVLVLLPKVRGKLF